jgi:hypothetical protein
MAGCSNGPRVTSFVCELVFARCEYTTERRVPVHADMRLRAHQPALSPIPSRLCLKRRQRWYSSPLSLRRTPALFSTRLSRLIAGSRGNSRLHCGVVPAEWTSSVLCSGSRSFTVPFYQSLTVRCQMGRRQNTRNRESGRAHLAIQAGSHIRRGACSSPLLSLISS